MKKNVASQLIGAEMITAADGSAFTGAVLCYVTGDGGSQTLGGVGSPSGSCTHKGNGYHEYTPSQAETNYDHVSFTFVGTGAIPHTKEVFTSFPQTGDSFARLGAPAGASVSADVATVAGYIDTEVASIKAKTDNLPSSFPTNFSSLSITAAGLVAVTSNLKKNQALAGFTFKMTDSTNHNPATGKTVTAQRVLNGGSLGSCTNSVTEISNGIYTIDLAAGDLNANTVALHFTASGCDDLTIFTITQP